MYIGLNKKSAAEKLFKQKAGALYMNEEDDRISTTFILIKSQKKYVDFIAWVAPAAFISNKYYTERINQHASGLGIKICFFSIEGVAYSDYRYLQLYNIADKYRTFCVVDESLTIKNEEAGCTKRLMFMRGKFKYRLILSSAPLTKGVIDLYSQIKFMDPNILKMSRNQFIHCFLNLYPDDYRSWRRWSTPKDEEALVEIMMPYIYCCDIHDIDYKLNHYNYDFELTDKEALSYREEKENFLQDKTSLVFMEVAQRFQHMYTISKNKINALVKLVSALDERREKVVIYTKFLDEIVFFKESGIFANHKFVELTGQSNKQRAIRRFEDDTNIMFCTYRVNRLNLSLRYCNNIVYFSQTFDYKDKVQSLYNIYRKDRNEEINIHNFWVKTGLEELIKDNLSKKRDVLSNVCQMMSRQELLEL